MGAAGDHFDRIQNQIDELAETFRGTSLRERRNRLLILFASHSSLPTRDLVSLRIWQLTRYLPSAQYAKSRPLRFRYPKLSFSPPLGTYVDDSFGKISFLTGINQSTVNSYIRALALFSTAGSALFPVVRKNDKPDPNTSISVKDAREIIAEGSKIQGSRKTVTSYTLRHHAIARMMKDDLSQERIQYESGYSDMQSIRDIAHKYDFKLKRDPQFIRPMALGISVAGSVYDAFEDYYPNHLCENKRAS